MACSFYPVFKSRPRDAGRAGRRRGSVAARPAAPGLGRPPGARAGLSQRGTDCT